MRRLLWWCVLGTAAVAAGGMSGSRVVSVVLLLVVGRWMCRKLWRLAGRMVGSDE